MKMHSSMQAGPKADFKSSAKTRPEPGATKIGRGLFARIAKIVRMAMFAPLFILMGAASLNASAQEAWPKHPVRIIVAAGGGSSVEIFARVLGDRLSRALGQSFIIEPMPGGNGTIGTRAVVNAKPDGYTFLFAGNSVLVINPLMTKALPYDIEKDLTPVAPVVYVPLAIAVPANSPAHTLKELLDQSREKESFFATPGAASLSRLIGENLNEKAGTKFVNVAYPTGTAAEMDVIAGRVPVLIDGLGGAAPHVKSGKLRLLAVSTATRSKDFPDVPTISEVIPNFVVPGINSLVAPAGTPPQILDLLNKAINDVLKDPDLQQRFISIGGEAASGSRQDLDLILRDQRVTFSKLIEQAGIPIN